MIELLSFQSLSCTLGKITIQNLDLAFIIFVFVKKSSQGLTSEGLKSLFVPSLLPVNIVGYLPFLWKMLGSTLVHLDSLSSCLLSLHLISETSSFSFSLCVCLSFDFTHERKHDIFLSESGLICLTQRYIVFGNDIIPQILF